MTQTCEAIAKPQEKATGHVSRTGCKWSTSGISSDDFTTEKNISMDSCPVLSKSLDGSLPTSGRESLPATFIQKDISTIALLTIFPFNKKPNK